MCYDDETKTYYREHKAYTHQQALVFETEELAEEYIKLHMGEGYKAEYFGHSLSLAPFKIRNTANLG
jgi:hypothetical protein